MNTNIFQMPKTSTITSRTSSITNAFINSVIPVIYPSEEEIKQALNVLGMTEETICCAYCGDPATEWDHFYPLVVEQKPTGYISEIQNLVPCCGKCNQSKGNKNWEIWIESDARLSPKTRGVPDLELRKKRLNEYKNQFLRRRINIIAEIGEENWEKHMTNWKDLIEKMKESQEFAKQLRQILQSKENGRNTF